MIFEEIWPQIMSFTQMSKIDAQRLFDFAKQIPENSVIVELGTYQGGSAILIGLACKEKSMEIFTIDNYTQKLPLASSKETVEANFVKFGCKNVKIIEGDSVEIARVWTLPITMLFIDSGHTYEEVRKDIEAWLGKVVKNGVVLFDDYDSWMGVTKAVNEAIEDKRLGFDNHLLITRKFQ